MLWVLPMRAVMLVLLLLHEWEFTQLCAMKSCQPSSHAGSQPGTLSPYCCCSPSTCTACLPACACRRGCEQREHRRENECAGQCADSRGTAQPRQDGARPTQQAQHARHACTAGMHGRRAGGLISSATREGVLPLPAELGSARLGAHASCLAAFLSESAISVFLPACLPAGAAHGDWQQRDDWAGGHHPRGHE